jgi:hypothetical protein
LPSIAFICLDVVRAQSLRTVYPTLKDDDHSVVRCKAR